MTRYGRRTLGMLDELLEEYRFDILLGKKFREHSER